MSLKRTRTGEKSDLSDRYIKRHPAILEITVSLKFILSASTANLSLTNMFSRRLPPAS